VTRAREAGLAIRSTYFAPALVQWDGPDADEVDERVLRKMTYRDEPEGVLAVVEIPQRTLPANSTLILVAVGIEKPGNLGAMARTADAAGADALLVADARSDPWNPNAIRASTGAVFTLPIIDVTRDDVEALPQQKVAATLGAVTPHTAADYTTPTAFLVGAEDEGLPTAWRTLADMEVEIPMSGTTADSLNASTAAAVLLFEAVRQRA
jgi:TrmH family RNA methyltransferase